MSDRCPSCSGLFSDEQTRKRKCISCGAHVYRRWGKLLTKVQSEQYDVQSRKNAAALIGAAHAAIYDVKKIPAAPKEVRAMFLKRMDQEIDRIRTAGVAVATVSARQDRHCSACATLHGTAFNLISSASQLIPLHCARLTHSDPFCNVDLRLNLTLICPPC